MPHQKYHDSIFFPSGAAEAAVATTAQILRLEPYQPSSATAQPLPKEARTVIDVEAGEGSVLYTAPAGGRLATTYDSTCNRRNTRCIFSGIGFRVWNLPAPKPRPYAEVEGRALSLALLMKSKLLTEESMCAKSDCDWLSGLSNREVQTPA
ncbi:hypothetical protein AVEN_17927-1 [Araneus ventricosus]|uniref:Uncharacterized protein n=1 Tax=Araneus ventricosus TaxID=182803 RepID=A0A4Y2FZ01_ARAVE|nr:hypothetical protein AVEN_17927-1 [Araneus ventricosus]